MENWNQDHPERYSNFCWLFIQFQGHGCGPGVLDLLRSTEKGSLALPLPIHQKWRKPCINICKHILKFLNCVLLRVSTNNNYEQPIALFVIILAKNSFMNQHGVIYCWRQVGTTVTTSIGTKSTRQHDGCNIYYNKPRNLYNKRLSTCRQQIANRVNNGVAWKMPSCICSCQLCI